MHDMCHKPMLLQAMHDEDDEADVFDQMQRAQLSAMDSDSSAYFAARKQVRKKQAAQTQNAFARASRRS